MKAPTFECKQAALCLYSYLYSWINEAARQAKVTHRRIQPRSCGLFADMDRRWVLGVANINLNPILSLFQAVSTIPVTSGLADVDGLVGGQDRVALFDYLMPDVAAWVTESPPPLHVWAWL